MPCSNISFGYPKLHEAYKFSKILSKSLDPITYTLYNTYTTQCHVLTVTLMPQVRLMTVELPKVYIFGARTFVMQGAPADRRLLAGSYTVHLPPAYRRLTGLVMYS
jgi:hypothetical protein